VTKRVPCALAVVAILVLTGCVEVVAPSDIPGTYRRSYEFGTDELILEPGGTFRQTIEVNGPPRERVRQVGTWRYDGDLTLVTCLALADGFKRLNRSYREPGVCHMPVWRYLWRREVMIGSDEGNPYVQITPR
jgi:hypothetical protein